MQNMFIIGIKDQFAWRKSIKTDALVEDFQILKTCRTKFVVINMSYMKIQNGAKIQERRQNVFILHLWFLSFKSFIFFFLNSKW
jgi:hypothetical protein